MQRKQYIVLLSLPFVQTLLCARFLKFKYRSFKIASQYEFKMDPHVILIIVGEKMGQVKSSFVQDITIHL